MVRAGRFLFSFSKHSASRSKSLTPQTIAHTSMKTVTFSVPEGVDTKMNNRDAGSSDQRREPQAQPWYHHNGTLWQAISTEEIVAPPPLDKHIKQLSRLRLLTWNIDVLQPGTDIRMESAIDYLESTLGSGPAELPSVIFLQEMCDDDLGLLKKAKWVQKSFYMTDVANSYWNDSYYGTTILVDKRLTISNVFRVHYKSRFGRDGLFVDINIGRENKVLRLCNTHLESLISNPPLRPPQVTLAAKYLHAEDIHAGVLAGDLNAVQPFDKTLHVENNLQDAFLVLGGEEGQDEGFTWGYQSHEYSMKKYGPSRMDKVLFCGKVMVKSLERIGVGAKVGESKREELLGLTDGLDWITDHYGLDATLDILD
jgi:tyrosyl-DNA phosphodiesterase 2